MKTCSTCIYFEQEHATYGRCHFNPPILIAGKVSNGYEFPAVNAISWCGKHEHIEPVVGAVEQANQNLRAS